MTGAGWQHPRSKIMSKVLIIGSGGREHAIAWAIKNTAVERAEIFCAPGNAGIAQLAQIANISVDDQASLVSFAESKNIDLTFVGPEAPLAAGIVDLFTERQLPIIGPDAAGARQGIEKRTEAVQTLQTS